jgi:hypothetical protein
MQSKCHAAEEYDECDDCEEYLNCSKAVFDCKVNLSNTEKCEFEYGVLNEGGKEKAYE